MKEAKDPLSDWLDKIKGSTITEHSIFNKLSQHWESEFHKDMDALNVRLIILIIHIFYCISLRQSFMDINSDIYELFRY